MNHLSDLLNEKRNQCIIHQKEIADKRQEIISRGEKLFLHVVKLFNTLSDAGLKLRYGFSETAEPTPLQMLEPGSVQVMVHSISGYCHIRVADTKAIHSMIDKENSSIVPYIGLIEDFLAGKDIHDEKLYFVIQIEYGFRKPQYVVDGLYIRGENKSSEVLSFIMDILIQAEAADQGFLALDD